MKILRILIITLIFVPGISASLLNEVGGINQWLGGAGADYNRLTLDPQKQQANIFAPDVIRKAKFLGTDVIVYQPLLEMLTSTGGYREYQVNNNPARRTTAGCDVSQKSSNPTLFVFAYDWRKDNAENAVALKDYIGCVQKFYPDAKVNILTHSMGSLLARRYILDNSGTHNVKRLITIGAPWLGAPKAIYILETGKFFDNFILDRLYASILKPVIEFFPSSHQLLPSRAYYSLSDQSFLPFGEYATKQDMRLRRFFDANENGVFDENYSFGQLTDLLDEVQFPRSKPMQSGNIFHDKMGQDDWSKDQSGIQYFHFYGVQNKLKTIGKVLALKSPRFDSEGNVIYVNNYDYMTRQGDGTVPLISAERTKGLINLNAPNVVKRAFVSPSPRALDEASVEHTALTQNPKVWDAILSALKTNPPQSVFNRQRPARPIIQNVSFGGRQDPISTQDQSTEINPSEAYYLRISSSKTIEDFDVADASGKSISQIGDNPFRNSLPDVTVYDWDSTISVILPVEMPDDNFYRVTFKSSGSPMEIKLTKGVGNDPETATQIIRYLDINLPAGTKMMLKFTAQGVEDLRYDATGDGTFTERCIGS